MNSSIDLSFDSARNLRFPGISTTDCTFNSVSGIRRIYFMPDGEQIVFLALTYFQNKYYNNVSFTRFHMFNASGATIINEERNKILQSEQSLSNWMAEQLLALKQQKLRTRRNLVDEL